MGRIAPGLLLVIIAAIIDPADAEPPPPLNATHLSHGRFQNVTVYSPQGPPKSFVLLLSGDAGWDARVASLAQPLVQRGAMVAGIDWPAFKRKLESDGSQCEFPDGDLENLSHFLQAYYHLPTYLDPLLVGYSSGATLAYALLAQAPKDTFAGALTLGFCLRLNLDKPLCKGSGLTFTRGPRGQGVDFLPIARLGNPWVTLQGENDAVCKPAAAQDFVSRVRGAAMVGLPKVGHDLETPRLWMPQYTAAFENLAGRNSISRLGPAPAVLSDLPVIEAAAQGTGPSDSFAIIMSGDGGWAGLDQDVAAALSAQGIAVVGLDSLRYYWSPRTPAGLAADVDRMIRYYLVHFNKKRVLLIGYSQGADVLPFAVNRLSEDTRERVALAVIMGMSEHALFEFHMSNWITDDNSGPATFPEVNRIAGIPVLCIYGEDETGSLCPKLNPKKFTVAKLKGGHHFDGDYAGLARLILAAANR